ncbi:hypothetical protein [Caulifigura coniformis]|uniref:hypothetical protein n=1 Tax=Caulifigura coniformis TaxID=2527983 RepID=UPI0011A175D1|nr:hypothetical protein [Caulifigura coniformis]
MEPASGRQSIAVPVLVAAIAVALLSFLTGSRHRSSMSECPQCHQCTVEASRESPDVQLMSCTECRCVYRWSPLRR